MKKRIVVIIVAIVIGGITGFATYKILTKTESVVKIDNVPFTLNDIGEVFLDTDYAKDNNCKVSIDNETMKVVCDNTYEFYLEEYVLVLKLNNDGDTEIFKYMVDALETLWGSSYGDYYLTMDKVLNREAYVNGITYLNENNVIVLKVVMDSKLPVYEEKPIVDKVTIKDLNDYNYEYKENGYVINNLEVVYDEVIDYLIVAGSLNGPDLNAILKVILYDENNKVILEKELAMDEFDNYNQVYANFIVNILLDEENINYENIKGYSLSLSKK